MFELTNEQRKYFALPPVEPHWVRVTVQPSPYDLHDTYAWLDGRRVVKVLLFSGQPAYQYMEYSVDEQLSEDGTMLLPKTAKGKPKKFTAANLMKRTATGVTLSYYENYITLYSNVSQQDYYSSQYDDCPVHSLSDFAQWVSDWCRNTDEKALQEIHAFAAQPRKHQKFKEGDFFRFRINRTLYGYGRILLDYNKMRKDGTPNWEIFMGKPLCVGVYHIVTENPALTPEQLVGLPMLPPQMIMDNIFFYGECPIIGHRPVTESIDYPIHYGRSICAQDPDMVCYQCGKTYITLPGRSSHAGGFVFNGIGWSLHVRLSILQACIRENSNEPYWRMAPVGWTDGDLRAPKHRAVREAIQKKMGIL